MLLMSKIVHKHLIVRAEVGNPPKKGEIGFVTGWFTSLIKEINMKLLAGPFAKYVDVPGNRGFTCVAIIETSHIAMHVWDEQEPALMQLDVYTCGPLNPETIFAHMEDFTPKKIEYKYLDREHALIEIPVHPEEV
jgi:S-adenosylmethionine/arginine decarboxylase-like enzyme